MCEGEPMVSGKESEGLEDGGSVRGDQTLVVGAAVTSAEVEADGLHIPFPAEIEGGNPDSYTRKEEFTEAYVQ